MRFVRNVYNNNYHLQVSILWFFKRIIGAMWSLSREKTSFEKPLETVTAITDNKTHDTITTRSRLPPKPNNEYASSIIYRFLFDKSTNIKSQFISIIKIFLFSSLEYIDRYIITSSTLLLIKKKANINLCIVHELITI